MRPVLSTRCNCCCTLSRRSPSAWRHLSGRPPRPRRPRTQSPGCSRRLRCWCWRYSRQKSCTLHECRFWRRPGREKNLFTETKPKSKNSLELNNRIIKNQYTANTKKKKKLMIKKKKPSHKTCQNKKNHVIICFREFVKMNRKNNLRPWIPQMGDRPASCLDRCRG